MHGKHLPTPCSLLFESSLQIKYFKDYERRLSIILSENPFTIGVFIFTHIQKEIDLHITIVVCQFTSEVGSNKIVSSAIATKRFVISPPTDPF